MTRAKTDRAWSARPAPVRRTRRLPVLAWNPRVACRTLDGTAFILLDSRMLRLNEVATVIWEHFEHCATVETAVAGVLAIFAAGPTRVRADTQSLVRDLVRREVLVPAPAGVAQGRSS